MHPSKVHQSTGEPSSALRLGFTDIKSPGKRGSVIGGQTTPSRLSTVPTTSFSFDVTKSVNKAALSNEAQRILEELQEKAARIKADLVAKREAEGEADFGERRIATAKGKTGRYSAAHMAEFKKMDSIENHASAWRAKDFTPVVTPSGLKRTPSKANLDGTPSKSTLVRSPSKTNLEQSPQVPRRNLKRTSSVANLDSKPLPPSPTKSDRLASPSKPRALPAVSQSPVKRLKQRKEDDISSNRPVRKELPSTAPRAVQSRPLPKTQSTFSRLMSPTKSSRGHTTSPTKPTISLVSTPTKPAASFTSKASYGNLPSIPKPESLKRRILSPARIQKVKSILRGGTGNTTDERSAIPAPMPQVSQTPGPPRTTKELPPAPLTTPRRKLTKRVTFTPDTKRAALAQNSPSPVKSGLLKFVSAPGSGNKKSPAPDNILTESTAGYVAYPDLSAYSHLIGSNEKADDAGSPGPGTFSFRSDHTIKFGNSSQTGFGACPGQSSIRQVRQSLNQSGPMPGSFPAPPAPSSHPDKENKEPASSNKVLTGVAHGLSNKKRHRPSTDEEDAEREAAARASKRRRNGDAPSRLAGSTPLSTAKKARLDRSTTTTPSKTPTRPLSRTPGSVSSVKKTPGLSMSRLNMLSRPKNRV